MLTWENLNKDNEKELENYNIYSKNFNVLNRDFITEYYYSNFLKKFVLRKKCKVLRMSNSLVGFLWSDSLKSDKCFINEFYMLPNLDLDKMDLSVFEEIFPSECRIAYICEDNLLNQSVLTQLKFKRKNSIIEMKLDINEYKFMDEAQVNDYLYFETVQEGLHEKIRCSVQNNIFQSNSRVPLTYADIIEDEKQSYYIKGGGIFLKYKDEYIGYAQVIRESGFLTIVNFGITPQHRRKGYGKILIDKMIKFSNRLYPKETIIKIKVYDNNIPAINLYKSMGFIENKKISTWILTKSKLLMDKI